MSGAGSEAAASRPLLVFHPAGVFFALAAAMAVALPWLWLFPLQDPRLAHVRLGLFGFGGMAVCGYVLTAQRAWTGRAPPLPALALAASALAARLAALGFPQALWPLLLLLPAALTALWPVMRAGRRDKVPLAAAPLLLVGAEALLSGWPDGAGLLPMGMAALIFVVGGRLVPAFTAEARRRRGLRVSRRPPLWPGVVLLAAGLFHAGGPGSLALLAALAWVALFSLDGLRLGPANRMLCLGYAGLVPGILAVVAARYALVPQIVQVHVLTMATMGPMILAIAARVAMRRPVGAELVPLGRHWAAFGLILAAAIARALAELPGAPPAWLTVAGIGWSAAWALFLSAHLQAWMRPAPFPLLSALRHEA